MVNSMVCCRFEKSNTYPYLNPPVTRLSQCYPYPCHTLQVQQYNVRDSAMINNGTVRAVQQYEIK